MNKPDPQNKLVKDVLILGSGELLAKSISFILLPIYSRFLLPEEYGQFDYIISIQMIMVLLIGLQLSNGVIRFVIKSEYESKNIVSTAFTSLIISAGCWLLIFLGANFIFRFSIANLQLILILFGFGLLDDFLGNLLRAFSKLKIYAISKIIFALLISVFSIIFIISLRLGLHGLYYAYSIAYIAVVAFLFVKTGIIKYYRPSWFSKAVLKDIFHYCLPLIPVVLCWWIINYSNRLIIKETLGLSALGVYAVSAKFAMIVAGIISVFNRAWLTNSVAMYYDPRKNELFTETFNRFSKILVSIVCGMMLLIQYVQPLFAEGYTDIWKYANILLLSSVFDGLALFYGAGYTCAKKTWPALHTTAVAAAVNITVILSLISRIGIYAAPIAMLLAFAVLAAIRMRTTRVYFRVAANSKRTILGLLLVGICYMQNYLSIGIWIHILRAAICILIIMLNLKTVRYVLREFGRMIGR